MTSYVHVSPQQRGNAWADYRGICNQNGDFTPASCAAAGFAASIFTKGRAGACSNARRRRLMVPNGPEDVDEQMLKQIEEAGYKTALENCSEDLKKSARAKCGSCTD